MQHVHSIGGPHGVDRTERIAPMILHQFVHARALPFPRLGRLGRPTQLHDEQRNTKFLLHRDREVSALGWDWVGRLRGTTLVKPVEVEDRKDQWVGCRALHPLACGRPRLLPAMHVYRGRPLACCLAVYRKPGKGRKHVTRHGKVARSKLSRQCAAREREPWVIIASPGLSDMSAPQLVVLYGRRMQIEASFRDLKSHRYGHGFEDSLTRKGHRLDILLLVNAMAIFAQWLAGLDARRPELISGCIRPNDGASCTRRSASGVRRWSDAGPWSRSGTGSNDCENFPSSYSIRWSRHHENVGIPQGQITVLHNVRFGSEAAKLAA